MSGPDEFDWIDRLRAQTTAPEALGLLDDAAIIPSRRGHDLIVSKDMLVEGVHFLHGITGAALAWRALAVSVSDLAAKGAKPYGYLLGVGWPSGTPAEYQDAFIAGLAEAESAMGIRLFGGDTVGTADGIIVSVTVLGWVEEGHMVRRDDAVSNTQLCVSGTIGDGWLGLLAARGELAGLADEHIHRLIRRFEAPMPRIDLDTGSLDACADVSDGLVADAGHIARASGVGLSIDLECVPLSVETGAWLDQQPDREAALVDLVTHGDDYELVATGLSAPEGFTAIGRVMEGEGVQVLLYGRPVTVSRAGWRHGKDG